MIKEFLLLLEDLNVIYRYSKKLNMVDFEYEGAIHNVIFEDGGVIMLNGEIVTYKELIYSIF
jgi:hypothetical protein